MNIDNGEVSFFSYDELKAETPAAWLLVINGDPYWFPKSLCSLDKEDMEIEMPSWMAEAKGLV